MPVTRRAALMGAAVAASLPRLAHAAAGGTLNVLQSEAPRSMDPGDHTASFTAAVLDPMYEGLVRRNAKLELEPALATGWTAEDGGKTWRFTLREGVTFHDGAPFDAAAAAASLLRFLDPKRGLAAAGRVKAILAGARAIDPRTLEVTLLQPYPGILPLLATNQLGMVSPRAEAAGTLARAAVGTGPFRLVEYRSGEFVQQARHDGYWGPKPSLDGIRWTWSTEASVLSMALQTGDADVVNPLPPVFAATTARNPRMKLLQTDGAFVYWCALNTKLKPLDDLRVRQALNFATDRPALVQALLLGNGRPAASPLAPVSPGFDPSLDLYPYDVAKAKALLSDAGVGSGFSLNVIVQEQEANIAEALGGMWSKAGVTLNVQRMESGLWLKTGAGGADDAGGEGGGQGGRRDRVLVRGGRSTRTCSSGRFTPARARRRRGSISGFTATRHWTRCWIRRRARWTTRPAPPPTRKRSAWSRKGRRRCCCTTRRTWSRRPRTCRACGSSPAAPWR